MAKTYKLTPRMEQHLRASLGKYHDLFSGKGCQGWELEELIVGAIVSDTQAKHSPSWKEAGHDDKADIVVRTNGTQHSVQIKSGKLSKNKNPEKNTLTISGHRLGRFNEDFKDITNYLNQSGANIIAVPHEKIDSDTGRHHKYTLCYIPIDLLRGISTSGWALKGKRYHQLNERGVEFSLIPSMSWQIWWKIPLALIEQSGDFTIG